MIPYPYTTMRLTSHQKHLNRRRTNQIFFPPGDSLRKRLSDNNKTIGTMAPERLSATDENKIKINPITVDDGIGMNFHPSQNLDYHFELLLQGNGTKHYKLFQKTSSTTTAPITQ